MNKAIPKTKFVFDSVLSPKHLALSVGLGPQRGSITLEVVEKVKENTTSLTPAPSPSFNCNFTLNSMLLSLEIFMLYGLTAFKVVNCPELSQDKMGSKQTNKQINKWKLIVSIN